MNDKKMTIQGLRDKIHKFHVKRKWDKEDPKDIAVSIALEAAEVLELFQWRGGKEVLQNEKLIEEFIERQIDGHRSYKAIDRCPENDALIHYIWAVFEESNPDSDHQYVDSHLRECDNCLEAAFYEAAGFSGSQYNPLAMKMLQKTRDYHIAEGDCSEQYKADPNYSAKTPPA